MGERRRRIRASEVGEYLYCARAWRMRADGVEPTSGREALAAGTRWHRRHGRDVVRARRLRLLAACAALAALALLLLLALLWLRR